jgi:hypothetical protein
VVEDVTRTAQAEVYEMKTVDMPEMTMTMMTVLRCSGGKFFWMFAEDQSSTRIDATRRMGMVRRLL